MITIINFINTDTIKDGWDVKVGIYYIDFEKASRLIDKLKFKETVLSESYTMNDYKLAISKNGIKVNFHTTPIPNSIRAHRNHIVLVDKSILKDIKLLDFFNEQILNTIVDYNVKDEYKADINFEPRIIFY